MSDPRDVRESHHDASGDMGVSSEREGPTGPGQTGTDGVRDVTAGAGRLTRTPRPSSAPARWRRTPRASSPRRATPRRTRALTGSCPAGSSWRDPRSAGDRVASLALRRQQAWRSPVSRGSRRPLVSRRRARPAAERVRRPPACRGDRRRRGRCGGPPTHRPSGSDAPRTGPSATRWCGAAYVTSTATMSPGRTSASAGGVKCTSRLSGARPESRWVAASLRPSPSATISSTARPTSALFSSQAISLTSSTSRS